MKERVELHQQIRLASGYPMGYPGGAFPTAGASAPAAGERGGCSGLGRLFDTMAVQLVAPP